MTIEILETLSDEYKPNQIFVAFWSNKRDQKLCLDFRREFDLVPPPC